MFRCSLCFIVPCVSLFLVFHSSLCFTVPFVSLFLVFRGIGEYKSIQKHVVDSQLLRDDATAQSAFDQR